VVLSIAISVLSALTFLSASAADATGTFLEYMARFTDLAKRKTGKNRGGPAHLADKTGPLSLGAMSFEELEDFFAVQLSHGPVNRGQGATGVWTGSGGLRNRPDVPRLAHDPLLVMCYDAGLVDGSGALLPHVDVDTVASLWDSAGFFGRASSLTGKAGAVLLLRLLAWKNIAAIMSPPSIAGAATLDMERALRYVFVSGVRDGTSVAMYKALTGLPQQYQVSAGGQVAEIKPVLHHRSSFAMLCPTDSQRTRPGTAWITRPTHGIVSCVVFVLSADTTPSSVGLHESSSPTANNTQAQEQTAAPAVGPSQLDMVWQVLALRRPVLLAISEASKVTPQAGEALVLQWRSCLKEEAARRGLEAEHVTVMLTELLDIPPAGAVGLPQIQDWLAQSLAQSADR